MVKDLTVEIAGHDVINHVGSAALRIIADRTGLAVGLSWALARSGFVPVHDRGGILADTAVLIADGGRVLSDLATLRDQAELFGPVASDPTLWRALSEIGTPQRRRIARARARTREHVWSLIAQRHGRIPPSRVADTDLGTTIVICMDASLVTAHSDKELAAGTYKGTWGHHPRRSGVTTPANRWRRCCYARAAPGPTPWPITSPSSTRRSPRSRPGTAATCWSPWTVPVPPTASSTTSPHSTPRPGAGCTTGPGPSTLNLDRDQPGLVPRCHHHLRPAVLATPALPRRTPGQSRSCWLIPDHAARVSSSRVRWLVGVRWMGWSFQ